MTFSARRFAIALSIPTLLPASRPEPAAKAAAMPPVFLNHFFVVVDAESYAAMLQDPYLTTGFAPFEKRTTVRADMTYTGAYWYGRKTYFEVFEPPAQGPVGASGMAFGVEGAGESAAVREAWNASLGAAQTSSVTRRTESAEPVWFHMTAGRGAPGGLRLWLMEYHREFLARWYPGLTPARGITRGELLDRYVAKIGRMEDRESAALGDITGLVVALDETDRGLLEKHLLPVGWTAKAGSGPGDVALTGPEGVTIEVVKSTAKRRGVLEARFSVQGPKGGHSATLGQVRVEVEPAGARLRFAP